MTDSDSDSDTVDRTDAEQDATEFEAEWDIEDTQQDDGIQIVTVDGMGEASCYLATYGDFEKYNRGGSDATLTPADVAQIIRSKYVSPSFDNLTGQKVASMKPMIPGALLDAITGDDTDINMHSDGSATVSRTDEGK